MLDQPLGVTLQQSIEHEMPVALADFDPAAQPTGLVIVDEVHGFCTVGAGPLAPQAPNGQVDRMVQKTDALARRFEAEGWPMMAFLDTHEPGKPEPPYPAHCQRGTGQEELVPELKWLENESKQATLLRKDCINGFVGGIQGNRNLVVDWVNDNRLQAILVVGICTDICVMDFVLTMLSARNHDLMPTLKDIVVDAGACATYDMPREAAEAQGLPATMAHPQALAHHLG
ncbi:MAG: isochorismatase family protein, partial [Alphaproteobacteria bacterium]|nr:isochorismatase family protein [Alphaproteobacteria bacterium]